MTDDFEEELEPNFPILLPIWWLLIWRSQVIALILVLAIGLVVAFLDALFGTKSGMVVATILGPPLGLAAGFWVLNMALRKRYKGFRVAVISTDAGAKFE